MDLLQALAVASFCVLSIADFGQPGHLGFCQASSRCQVKRCASWQCAGGAAPVPLQRICAERSSRGTLSAVGALLVFAAAHRSSAAWAVGHSRRTESRRCQVQSSLAALGDEDNVALLFVKPHACTPKVLELVPELLTQRGIEITKTGSITAAEIDERGAIDDHYAAIARVGIAREPSALGFGAEEAQRFLEGYSRSLDEALAAGKVYSAVTAMEALGIDPSELLSRCLAAGYEKLKSGLYCARLEGGKGGPQELYVLNGFYARMREKFVAPGVVVHWYLISFNAAQLPWATFRREVIGATNPSDAADGSLRAKIRDDWQTLGLQTETNYQDNGVHASAGPLEALRERAIWLGTDPCKDDFGSVVASRCTVPVEVLIENPLVDLGGQQGPVFDLLEDVDTAAALDALSSCALVSDTPEA
mmetsp:Transcript_48775/g.113051  ORF Transcript_48775/g.113051 Transcript_48775/m.113051 type:complete len:419 (+) Transcript_48775:2-1258(+)